MNTIIEIPIALFLDRVVLSGCSYVFSVLAAEYERVASVLKTSTPLKDKVDSWKWSVWTIAKVFAKTGMYIPCEIQRAN